MISLRVGAAAVNQIPLAWEHNLNNIVNVIKEARDRDVEVVCFPELCITGYGCEDQFLSQNTLSKALESLFKILPHTKGIAVAVGLPLMHQNILYNTACFIVDGAIQGFAAKQNLARAGVHYEPRWFMPWPSAKETEIELNILNKPMRFPLGDMVFSLEKSNIGSIKVGFEICEDAWVEKRIGYSLCERNVHLILNPSASHFALSKCDLRKEFVCEGSKQFNVAYVYANLLGNEAGRLIYDGDTLIASQGEFLANGPRFSFQETLLTTADINFESIVQTKDKNKSWKEKIKNHSKQEEQTKQTNENNTHLQTMNNTWEESAYRKEEEFTRAITLGLFDYLRKSKAHGFVMNLSGGADSSACAILVYLMLQLAVQTLGKEKFQKKLNFIPGIAELPLSTPGADFKQQIMKNLLFCLFQGTVNNSTETRQSAQELSKAINCSFAEMEVDKLIQQYCDEITHIIKRPLTWEKDSIALQNIQARVRSPSLWLLANIRNALVISTANRSEASTGYITMDGDTAGGLSPLLGIDKKFILQWLHWLNKEGMKDIGPISALDRVLKLSPSAELKPLDQHQTDEADLMSFDWLEKIERWFVDDKLSPSEILLLMREDYPKEDPHKIGEAIERFFKLWTHSQWKRERVAPSFHLDYHSVDPKTWCRYPILSEGYSKEIAEMWEIIKQH